MDFLLRDMRQLKSTSKIDSLKSLLATPSKMMKNDLMYTAVESNEGL